MIRQVAQTIARHKMLRAGDRVCVAVSGGADSVALLHVLRDLADELGITLAIAHLNHKLRGPESDEDERFVAELGVRLGLPFFSHTVDVAAAASKNRENIEQVGRNSRYQWFTRLLHQGLADKIALGHTQGDQAETVLYRLLRGSGSAGLAGIRPVLAGGVVRPLIEVSRHDVVGYLRCRKERWREDSSNLRPDFARNRIRQELLPQLEREWNPRLPRVLSHLAAWAQDEEDYWQGQLARLAGDLIEARSDGVYVDVTKLQTLETAVAKRLLRRAMEQAKGDLRGIEYEHVEAVRDLARPGKGSGGLDLPGMSVRRSFEWLRFMTAGDTRDAASQEYWFEVQVPGRYALPDGTAEIEFHLCSESDTKPGYNEKRRQALDWKRLSGPLQLRNWRAGDAYRPRGRAREKKLKALFQESKIPVWDRARWPVVCFSATTTKPLDERSQDGQTVVWSRGFGPSADFAAGEATDTLLEIVVKTGKGADFS